MEPVLRVSGQKALILTLNGATESQTSVIRDIFKSSYGADPNAAPSFISRPQNSSSGPVLTGTAYQLKSFIRSCSERNVLPRQIWNNAESLLDNYLRTDYKINCRGKVLDLGKRSYIMGVLNVTPDSFSDGGLYSDPQRALLHAREMEAAGADIIDIGGESSRPGALPLSEEEELRRILPLIERISAELTVPVSVDTYKSGVAEKALRAGAVLVNDISGLRFSPDMARIAADHDAAVIIMHIKGTPRDMQHDPSYQDVIGEIRSYLSEGIEIAERSGLDREKILIDPGIGFGKTLEHNLEILNRLEEFRVLGRPLVLGTSRKKFIGTILNIPVPDQRVDGTAATVALGIERGASVLRVHDVARMTQVARMADAIVKANSTSVSDSQQY